MKNSTDLTIYNNVVLSLHLIQFIVLCIISEVILTDRDQDIIFVSGKINLKYTNYALIDYYNQNKTCSNVLNSPMRTIMFEPFKDFMPHHLYDFRNKTIVEYFVTGYSLETYRMMYVFFLLSFLFQFYNSAFIGFDNDEPRIIHFLEYSISSSLMVMVLAVNLGILELYTIVAFASLFFGMNMLGACAEILSNKLRATWWWMLPHFAGWVLFIACYGPIFWTFRQTVNCSVGIPWYVELAIYLELVFFSAFGITQFAILYYATVDPELDANYWKDVSSITLSALAKTFLAWILIGPVLSMNNKPYNS